MTIDLTDQIHQYLTTAPSSLFAQQEVEMLAHWEGDANLLWRVGVKGQQSVVKLFLDAGQARSRRQFDGHTTFAPYGLAPQPLWADRYPHGLSRQLIVYKWVEGETIQPNDPTMLAAWAEAIGILHTSPPEEVRRFSPHPINLDYYWRIEQASIAQIENWLAPSGLALKTLFHTLATATAQLARASLPLWANASPTPIHGDLSVEHTRLERGRVILLDWEMFGLGDPALDVARLLNREAHSLDADHVEQWLDSYLRYVDQPELSTRINIFRQLLEVHNVFYLLLGLQEHTAGQLSSELREAMPFMQTALSTALNRAFVALDIEGGTDSQNHVADFFTWLNEAAATSSSSRQSI